MASLDKDAKTADMAVDEPTHTCVVDSKCECVKEATALAENSSIEQESADVCSHEYIQTDNERAHDTNLSLHHSDQHLIDTKCVLGLHDYEPFNIKLEGMDQYKQESLEEGHIEPTTASSHSSSGIIIQEPNIYTTDRSVMHSSEDSAVCDPMHSSEDSAECDPMFYIDIKPDPSPLSDTITSQIGVLSNNITESLPHSHTINK